jgi:hypothetical protein
LGQHFGAIAVVVDDVFNVTANSRAAGSTHYRVADAQGIPPIYYLGGNSQGPPPWKLLIP